MSPSSADPPLPPRAALRWDVVRRIVAECRPDNILELGCGLGSVGARLARTATYTGAEPDPQSFRVAHRRITPLGGTVLNGDHHRVPAGRYDLVCAFEVLEHIADDVGALAQWLPLVAPNGHLLLSVPADPDRFGPWDTLVGHYRRYSAGQLRQRLLDTGASRVRVVHYGWPLGYLLDSVRDHMAGREADGSAVPKPRGGTAEERTSASGRILQPSGVLAGGAIRLAVAPFVALQRMRPDRGPGLVALASYA